MHSSTDRDATPDGPRPALDVRSTLEEAVAAHKQGRLSAARAGYEEILRLSPENFDALHLLGVIALQEQHPEEGVASSGERCVSQRVAAALHRWRRDAQSAL